MKTAYQIADELEERNAPYEDDTANFIRQQQAEIDSLRKNLDVAFMMIDDLEKGLDSSINLNKAQAERKEK